MASSTQDRDEQLLSIGKQCSHPSCLLVDFLPFKCQHCEDAFCQEHFMVSAHNCPKYDETKHNRVAPNCPLCHVPVAVRPGQDPNDRMEEHFVRECAVMTGKSGKANSGPVCARGSCKKVLFSPIRCDNCREQFCPAHRFPKDHNCLVTPPASKLAPSRPLAGLTAANLNTKASAAGAATMGALKKTLASAQIARPSPVSKATTSTTATTTSKPTAASSSHSNPFSKSDRPASPSLSSTILNNDTNAMATTAATPKSDPTPLPDNTKSMPPPIIDPMSFVPRPIFASA